MKIEYPILNDQCPNIEVAGRQVGAWSTTTKIIKFIPIDMVRYIFDTTDTYPFNFKRDNFSSTPLRLSLNVKPPPSQVGFTAAGLQKRKNRWSRKRL